MTSDHEIADSSDAALAELEDGPPLPFDHVKRWVYYLDIEVMERLCVRHCLRLGRRDPFDVLPAYYLSDVKAAKDCRSRERREKTNAIDNPLTLRILAESVISAALETMIEARSAKLGDIADTDPSPEDYSLREWRKAAADSMSALYAAMADAPTGAIGAMPYHITADDEGDLAIDDVGDDIRKLRSCIEGLRDKTIELKAATLRIVKG